MFRIGYNEYVRGTLLPFLIGLLVMPVVTASCGSGSVDRTAYVEQNIALLRSVPPPPSATLADERSEPYTRYSDGEGDVIGYSTIRVYTIPPHTTAAQLRRFYVRRLPPKWSYEPNSAPTIGFSSGSAWLDIEYERGRVRLYADHDYVK